MKTLVLIAGAFASAALFVQTTETKTAMGFQQLTAIVPDGPANLKLHLMSSDANGQPVAGKPFSATEEHRTVQTLADGTHIEHSDTNQYARDDQGRTRSEFGPKGFTHAMIRDPVAGVYFDLDTVNKTAHKFPG